MASAETSRDVTVVGVDGSDASKAALSWAIQHGRRTGSTVRAVTAWRIDPPFGAGPAKNDESFEREASAALDAVLEDARSAEPDFPVETRVDRGEPSTVLLKHAQAADLLVLGDKGRGVVTGLLAGSMVLRTLHDAPCPVVIVGQRMGPGPR